MEDKAKKRKTSAESLLKSQKVDEYVMGWVVQLDEQVLFGPLPSNAADYYYLAQKGVTHIVNLKLSKWAEKKAKDKGFDVWDVPVPEEILQDKIKEEAKAQLYVAMAKKIQSDMGKTTCVYLCFKDGVAEEAYVAFALWKLRNKKEKTDPLLWCKQNKQSQVCKMAAEKDMMNRVWKQVKMQTEGIASFFVK